MILVAATLVIGCHDWFHSLGACISKSFQYLYVKIRIFKSVTVQLEGQLLANQKQFWKFLTQFSTWIFLMA